MSAQSSRAFGKPGEPKSVRKSPTKSKNEEPRRTRNMPPTPQPSKPSATEYERS